VGAEGSGFQVILSDASDYFVMRGSLLDFPASVWVSVADRGGKGGGRIEIRDSRLRSQDPGTDGISLTAGERGGVVLFSHVTLDVPEDAPALVFAGTCEMDHVAGAPATCSL
jgi:hypothetical protein